MTRRDQRGGVLAVAALTLAATLATTGAGPVAASATTASAGSRGPVEAALCTVPLTSWGNGGYLYEVNRAGQVLGALIDEAGATEPVLWRDYGSPRELGVVGGYARALNNRGHAAGIEGVAGDGNGWLWTPERVTVLSAPGQRVWVNDLNDHDQVVGDLEDPVSGVSSNAFLWQRGRFTEIVAPEGMVSHALKVNNRGEVLGYVVNADWSVNISFVWHAGTMTLLEAPGGGRVQPVDING